MEWIGSLVATLVVALLFVPLVAAVGCVFLLAAADWGFSGSPSVTRTRFFCPFSMRAVTTGFLTQPGSRSPVDVVSCSRFADEHAVTCRKECRKLATAGWTASPMEPRYALLSGGVAYRPVAVTAGEAPIV